MDYCKYAKLGNHKIIAKAGSRYFERVNICFMFHDLHKHKDHDALGSLLTVD